MSVGIRMPDGTKDRWGFSYIESVVKNRSKFQTAITKLDSVIKKIDHAERQRRLAEVPGDIDKLWGDYWGTEHMIEGVNKCIEDYETTVKELKIARDNLDMLLKASLWVFESSDRIHKLMRGQNFDYN